jgi:hypothetical protein
LLFIVCAFFNDTITVAVWTGFHVRLMEMLSHTRDYIRWCFADTELAAAFRVQFSGRRIGHLQCRLTRHSALVGFIYSSGNG